MTRVVVAPAAAEDLARLVITHSLPADTIKRVKRSLQPLSDFPLLGAPLKGRWSELRFILGPWRWMVVVYSFDEERDQVSVVTVQDGRSYRAPTSSA
jgi:plasmid stabilization system protein ParE